MYAIADKDYDISEKAIENVGGADPELNSKIESLFCWGIQTKAGIPTADGTDHQATNYMPPVQSPDLYNADNAAVDPNFDVAANFDYVQTGHSLSYKEMAIFKYAEEPTVGSMPLYQWAYVDPEGLKANWDDLYTRADAELDVVVRAKVYEIVKQEITDAVNKDGSITASNKPAEIESRLAAADAVGAEIDQRTAQRLADATLSGQDRQEHYVTLLKNIICDYDEAFNYKVYETDTEGNVVLDEDKNPVETEEFLLVDNNGELLHVVEDSEYVWVSRLIDRFVELNKYKLVDAEEKEEILNEPPKVDRDELYDKYFGDGNKAAIYNNGTHTVNGVTYTKYKQTGGNKEYYLGSDGKFYTMTVTEVPAVTETVNKLTTGGLVAIIACAAIVVAGVAVLVILVVKKKNRPVAADDVAAEGEIQVIDESNNMPQ